MIYIVILRFSNLIDWFRNELLQAGKAFDARFIHMFSKMELFVEYYDQVIDIVPGLNRFMAKSLWALIGTEKSEFLGNVILIPILKLQHDQIEQLFLS